MRMSVYQFFIDTIDHVFDVKIPGLRSDFRIKYNVQQQVTQFLANFIHVPVEYGIAQFIGFLDREMTKGFQGLLFIPGAFLPKLIHDVKQLAKGLELFFSVVHILGSCLFGRGFLFAGFVFNGVFFKAFKIKFSLHQGVVPGNHFFDI